MVRIFEEPVPESHNIAQMIGMGAGRSISDSLNQMLQAKQQRRALEGLRPFLEQGGLGPEQIQQVLQSGISPEIALTALKTSAPIAAKRGTQEDKALGQDVFNRMAELVKGGKLGFGSKARAGVFGGKTAEDVGEFQSLSGQLEAELVDRVNRGTLSNARFKYITETLLPKPNDRDAVIRGKLKGLAKMLDLDESALTKKASKSTGEKIRIRLPDGRESDVSREDLPRLKKLSKEHFDKDIELVK